MRFMVLGAVEPVVASWLDALSSDADNVTIYLAPTVDSAEEVLSSEIAFDVVVFASSMCNAKIDNYFCRISELARSSTKLKAVVCRSNSEILFGDSHHWVKIDSKLGLGEVTRLVFKSSNRSYECLSDISTDSKLRTEIAHRPTRLTPRQMEVLTLVNKGKSNKEIARDLTLTEGTVKVHCKAIFRALGVVNRTQAAVMIAKAGFVSEVKV